MAAINKRNRTELNETERNGTEQKRHTQTHTHTHTYNEHLVGCNCQLISSLTGVASSSSPYFYFSSFLFSSTSSPFFFFSSLYSSFFFSFFPFKSFNLQVHFIIKEGFDNPIEYLI